MSGEPPSHVPPNPPLAGTHSRSVPPGPMAPSPVIHAGRLRWYDADYNLHCIPAPETPPLYASEAAALEDLTTPRGYAAAAWSKDL